jgi:hypothetical protein
MSSSCGDWDNPVYPRTFVDTRLEIECAGCPPHRVSCGIGNIHHILWSDRKYLAQKMVRLDFDCGLRIWDVG